MSFLTISCFVATMAFANRIGEAIELEKVGEPFAGLKRGSISEVLHQRVAGPASPQLRIVSGKLASQKQIPYQVALVVGFENSEKTHVYGFCGGTLINNEWIVTAAHCTSGSTSIEVRLGGIYRDSPRRISSGLVNYVHPNWASNGDDIALVKIQRVDYDDYISAASLPPINGQYSEYVGQGVVASGWGSVDDEGTGTDRLKFVAMTVMDKNVCARYYGPTAKRPNILCTDPKGIAGTCSGDSGGPLVLKSTRTLIGVVTFVAANACAKGFPDGFSRITNYLDWIHQVSGISG